jgi:hypothetical protein
VFRSIGKALPHGTGRIDYQGSSRSHGRRTDRVDYYLQFFIGLEAFQYSPPFDPSMKVYFRKRPEAFVNDCTDWIVRSCLKVIRALDPRGPGDNYDSDGSTATRAQVKASPQRQMNQGSLLIDATCARISAMPLIYRCSMKPGR